MSNFLKFLIVTLVVVIAVGVFITFDVFGSATQSLTLTTNTDLENGLINHWTFDGPYTVASTTVFTTAGGGSGSTASTTPGTGSNLAASGVCSWTSPTNIQTDDTNNAQCDGKGGSSDYLQGTNFGFSIPAGATIDGIVVDYARIQEENNGQDWTTTEFKLTYSGGTLTANASGMNTASWSTTEEIITEGGVSDTWGRTWSASEINASDFGVVLKVNRVQTQGPPAWAEVDHYHVSVYYTETGSTVYPEFASTTDRISGTEYLSSTTTIVTPGVLGSALDFDGDSAYVDIGDAQPSSSDIVKTISFWVKDDRTLTGTQEILGCSSFFAQTSNGEVQADLGAIDQTYYVNGVQGERTITSGNWYHVAVSSPTGDDPSANCYLGTATNSGSYLDGKLDDVRFYNRELSQSEVQRLYELGATTHINKTLDLNSDLFKDDLIGYWTFDGLDIVWGDTTTEIKDRGPNGYHGDATSLSAIDVMIGKIGQALDFDGAADEVLLPDMSAAEDKIFTIATWVYADPTGSGNDYIFAEADTASDNSRMSLKVDTTNFFEIDLQDTLGTNVSTTGDVTDPRAAKSTGWHHVVGVGDGSNLRLYVNGIEEGTAQDISGLGSITNTAGSIGYLERLTPCCWADVIVDDVLYIDRALTQAEITRLYEMGKTTYINTTLTANPDLENGLVRHYTFDGKDTDWSAANEIIDRGSSGVDGDVGTGTKGAVRPGKIGQGYDFQIADDEVRTANTSLPTGDFTYALWVKPSANAIRLLLDSVNIGINSREVSLSRTASETITAVIDGNTTFTTNNSTPINKWSHVTLRRSGTSVQVFINGEVDSQSATDGDTLSFACDLTFGGGSNSTGTSCVDAAAAVLDGTLDDIRVYNRALSDAEILRLYQLGEGRIVE